ncbi:hypothetical protein HWV62_9571 [Athelia sp. TMB]|nr:hypothetical protein HWV62_9571 [Athelia sp. TMB]
MKAPDVSLNYNAARKKHQRGTGAWFLRGTTFSTWKDNPGSVIWLRGGPGSGKTILCSSVIEDVVEFCEQKPTSRGYAYFFFDGTRAQTETLTYESLLRSIIAQLSDRCGDNIPNVLLELYNKCDGGHRQPTETQLEDTLARILGTFDNTYIIVDSLDECAEKADLLRWIQSVVSKNSEKLHLMLTSRPEAAIERGLESLRNLKKVPVGGISTVDDIEVYLDACLKADGMSLWDDTDKQMIKTGLSADPDGMFRWVALQVDAINKCKNRKELKKQLESLPKGLDETYTQLFKRSDCPDYLERLLQWLAFSERPLAVKELAEVLAVDFASGDLPFYDPDMRCQTPAVIWSICNGLVTEFEGTVKLAHFSVKEYVVKRIKPKAEAQFSTSEQFSHSVIAQDCLAQLLHFDEPSVLDWEESHSLSRSLDYIGSSFPLAQYAAMNWVSHFQSSAAAPAHCLPLQNLLLRLFKSPPDTWSHALLCWVRVQNLVIDVDKYLRYGGTVLGRTMKSFRMANDLPLDVSPLYYACFAGSFHAVQHLISNGADVNKAGQELSTRPILLACEEGHLEIARLLLDGGADVNLEGGLYGTALQAAIAGDHLKLAKLLLAKGAHVNAEGGLYGSALQAASPKGHFKLAKLLLDKGAHVNVEGGFYGSALQAASVEGHLELAKLLLDKGADVNLERGQCGSALQAASAEGHLELAKLLLDKGADVNLGGGVNGSALQAASAEGHLELAKLLLDNGADVNIEGGEYGSALQAASARGHIELAKLLLDKGADVNLEGGEYGSALQVASAEGHLEIAKLLLDKEARVNLKGGEYGSALQAASARGHLEVAKLLLDNGASVNAKGLHGTTALLLASDNGRVAIAQLLREHGGRYS